MASQHIEYSFSVEEIQAACTEKCGLKKANFNLRKRGFSLEYEVVHKLRHAFEVGGWSAQNITIANFFK